MEESEKWDDHTSQPRPQGYLFARIRLNGGASESPLRLDVYVVHLQGECGIECQRKQLEQLARKITFHSRASVNPVLVLGDFNFEGPTTSAEAANVDAEFPGYRHILDVLGNPRDRGLRRTPSDPVYVASRQMSATSFALSLAKLAGCKGGPARA